MEKVYVLIDGEGKMKDCVVSLHRSKAEAEEAKKELNEICLGGRVCYIIESEIEPLKQDTASNSAPSDSFDQILREEFLINTQNYPKEYHELFWKKYKTAEQRFKNQ